MRATSPSVHPESGAGAPIGSPGRSWIPAERPKISTQPSWSSVSALASAEGSKLPGGAFSNAGPVELARLATRASRAESGRAQGVV